MGRCLAGLPRFARHLGEANVYTVCIGLGVLGVVTGSEAVAQIPGALIGLVAATIAVIWAILESKGVSVVGTVPGTLPTPSLRTSPARQWAHVSSPELPDRHRRHGTDRGGNAIVQIRIDKPADVDRDFLGAGAGIWPACSARSR